MNYRKKNTQALEDYRPDFLLKYKKAIESNHQSNIKVTSFPAKIESEYLVVETAGQTYRLVSSYSPEQEAKRWASQFVYQNLDIVVSIFGFGCGSLIRELLYGKENNMKVLVYEPSLEIFSYVFEHYDLTDLFRNSSLSICVKGVNEWDFEDIIGRSIHWTNVKSQIICTHPQYEKLFLEENRDFLTVVHENNTRTLVNRNTEAFFGRDIVENTLMNLKFVRSSITICDLMNQIPKDIPAIIVSAGPSLEKNIEELKRAKGKSFLVATDSAMKLLFSHDIVPDVFVTLDALKPESYLSDERFMQVPCICKIESNWRILYHHGVRKVYYSPQEYLKKIYEKFGKTISTFSSGGSVACAAFAICAELGFENIVLIGQDLAYNGEKSHAGDIGDGGKILGEEDGIRFVEGVDGSQVKTRHDWYIYLQWFEASVHEMRDKINVIDATEGGAKIHGTKIMSLKDVIDIYCHTTFDCVKCIKEMPLTLTDAEIRTVFQTMLHSKTELAMIRQSAKKACQLCTDIVASLERHGELTPDIEKNAKALEKLNGDIENNISYCLVDAYIADLALQTLEDLYIFSENEEEDRINTFKRAKRFYRSVLSAATAIEPILENACENFYEDEIGVKPHKKKTVVIMQARMGSTRLSGKVMKKISGKTVLEHDILRIRQAKLVDDIVIATTVNERDDIIEEEALRLGISVFRGSEENVLSRYYCAAKEAYADTIVRITSDCPLIDPKILDGVIAYYQEHDFDLVANVGIERSKRTFPRGFDVEVFSLEALRDAYQHAGEGYQREHVTPYLYEKRSVGYYLNDVDYSKYRLTLDTEEDFELITKIYEELYHGTHDFYMDEIIHLLEEKPEFVKINEHIEQKKIKG